MTTALVIHQRHVQWIDSDTLIIHVPDDLAEDIRAIAAWELRSIPRICAPIVMRHYRRLETTDGRVFVAETSDGMELRGPLRQVLRGLFALSLPRAGAMIRTALVPDTSDLRDVILPDGWTRDAEINNFCCFRARRDDLRANVSLISERAVSVMLTRSGIRSSAAVLHAEIGFIHFLLERADDILDCGIETEEGYLRVIDHDGAEAFCHSSDLEHTLKALIAGR
jgi:hypothetical protein